MASPAQKDAIRSHRRRLTERGLSRFEVQGRPADKELIRSLARKLAEGTAESARIRVTLADTVGASPKKGGVWDALRNSPLVGAGLEIERTDLQPRDVEL